MVAFIDEEERDGLLAEEEARRPNGRSDVESLAISYTSKNQKLLIGLLSISFFVNILLIVELLYPKSITESPSSYANLLRTREEPYVIITDYSSDNETLQDQLWHNINVDSAVVALSDEWADRHNLRTAQRFPWDQTKGIYILHGFHNLHCLKIVYLSLSEHRRGVPQTRSWHHISHCLDALRRQILCDADDTPRATDRRTEVVSGLLQHRKCRRWEDLEEFANQHTACYKRPESPESDQKSVLERFKHCPPNSAYVVTESYMPSDDFLVGLPEESLGEHHR